MSNSNDEDIRPAKDAEDDIIQIAEDKVEVLEQEEEEDKNKVSSTTTNNGENNSSKGLFLIMFQFM